MQLDSGGPFQSDIGDNQSSQSDWSFRISAPKPTADITVGTVSGANASLSLK